PSPSSEVPKPGFSRIPPPDELPGFDPSESPLDRGGLPSSHAPLPADSSFAGLGDPTAPRKRRAMVRVRREGWIARREQARSRFRTIFENRGSSTPRLFAGLERRGLLFRSKENAIRPRFNMRGLLRGS
ncbi:MAG: hypothetical protein D6731_25975, partial [Planctomycetota bacterium]